jgi:hypothetical protein
MSASDDQLRAHLLVIAEHARDALALLEESTPGLTLPKGSTACTHRRNSLGMGGYRTCLDCGFVWHE